MSDPPQRWCLGCFLPRAPLAVERPTQDCEANASYLPGRDARPPEIRTWDLTHLAFPSGGKIDWCHRHTSEVDLARTHIQHDSPKLGWLSSGWSTPGRSSSLLDLHQGRLYRWMYVRLDVRADDFQSGSRSGMLRPIPPVQELQPWHPKAISF